MNPAPITIMIAFTPAGLDYVFKLLMARPWGEVNGLVNDIQAQVNQQAGGKTPVEIAQRTKAVEPAEPGLTD